jgi:hypothetical protein
MFALGWLPPEEDNDLFLGHRLETFPTSWRLAHGLDCGPRGCQLQEYLETPEGASTIQKLPSGSRFRVHLTEGGGFAFNRIGADR